MDLVTGGNILKETGTEIDNVFTFAGSLLIPVKSLTIHSISFAKGYLVSILKALIERRRGEKEIRRRVSE